MTNNPVDPEKFKAAHRKLFAQGLVSFDVDALSDEQLDEFTADMKTFNDWLGSNE